MEDLLAFSSYPENISLSISLIWTPTEEVCHLMILEKLLLLKMGGWVAYIGRLQQSSRSLNQMLDLFWRISI